MAITASGVRRLRVMEDERYSGTGLRPDTHFVNAIQEIYYTKRYARRVRGTFARCKGTAGAWPSIRALDLNGTLELGLY